MQWARKTSNGFTIVELLIVVVVIAILAAITVVSYNGITRRATDAALRSSLSSIDKKLAVHAVDNPDYPLSLSSLGVAASASSTNYQYTANNATSPKGYCITAVEGSISMRLAKSYHYSGGPAEGLTTDGPQPGVCPGHSTSGAPIITNHAKNPSVEVSASLLTNPNGSTVERTTARARYGSASAEVTLPLSAGSSTTGISLFNVNDFIGTLEPNTGYTVSAWVWVDSAAPTVALSIQGTGKTDVSNGPERTSSQKGQWQRISNSFKTTTAGSLVIYVLNSIASPAAATKFWVDGIMLTESTELYDYADGSSAEWSWSGAEGLSPSSGPAF